MIGGVLTATILSGAMSSDIVDIGGNVLVALELPAALTGTTITVNASAFDGVTPSPMYSSAGTALSLTVSTSRYVYLTPDNFMGVRYVQLVSGSAEGATRLIKLVTRPIA